MTLFKKIPSIRWIELVVDGHLLNKEKGPSQFEAREPGSIEHVLNAFAFSLKHRKKPLSANHIKDLHNQVLMDVKGLFDSSIGRVRSSIGSAYFHIEKTFVTVEGLREFLMEYRAKPTNARLETPEGFNYLSKNASQFTAEDIYQSMRSLKYQAPNYKTEPELEAALDRLAEAYNEEIANAVEPREKLFIIVKYTQRFERLHPFFDGNGRTFVNVLLNTLLINNNFYPAIFFNPNIFDLYSVAQLVNVVIEAMWVCEYIALNPDKPLFYDHINLSFSEQAKLSAMSQKLVQELGSIPDQEQFTTPSQLLSDAHHLNLLHVVTGNLAALKSLPPDQISQLIDEHNLGKSDFSLLLKNVHAVHLAARFGHVAILEWMINRSNQLVHVSNCDGETALHFAARCSNIKTVETLLHHRADAKRCNNYQEDAITCAAESGTIEVFLFLAGKIPFRIEHISAAFFLKLLIKALQGCNIQVINQLCDRLETIPQLIPEIKLLISTNDNVKKYLNSAFDLFVISPHTEELRRLLTMGSALFPPHLNSSLLEKTIQWSKKTTFFLLIEYGVKPTRASLELIMLNEDREWVLQTIGLPSVTAGLLNHFTILHQAVKKYANDEVVLATLLAKGLNPYLVKDGSSIFHQISSTEINFLVYLKKQQGLNLFELKRANASGVTPLMRAVTLGDEHLVKFFLDNEVTSLPRYPNQPSILESIAKTGSIELLAIVLKRLSADHFQDAINNVQQEHPLIIMLNRKAFAMANFLLESGCCLDNVWDRTGQTLKERIKCIFLNDRAGADEQISTWLNSRNKPSKVIHKNPFGIFLSPKDHPGKATINSIRRHTFV